MKTEVTVQCWAPGPPEEDGRKENRAAGSGSFHGGQTLDKTLHLSARSSHLTGIWRPAAEGYSESWEPGLEYCSLPSRNEREYKKAPICFVWALFFLIADGSCAGKNNLFFGMNSFFPPDSKVWSGRKGWGGVSARFKAGRD